MKSSTSGTTLTAKEICEIIKACGAAKVQQARIAGMVLDFLPGIPARETSAYVQPAPASFLVPSDVNASRIEQETIAEQAQQAKEDQLAELLVTDPELYEEMVLNGEIEDA